MGTKTWEIEFGWNYDRKTVIADTVENAILKAWSLLKKEHGRNYVKETSDYWIRKVVCIAETDD